MKVRIIKAAGGSGYVFKKGSTVDLPKKVAEDLLKHGIAEKVKQERTATSTAAKTRRTAAKKNNKQ